MALTANGATGCNLFATGAPGGTDVVFASDSNAGERGSMTLGRLWTLKADYSSNAKGAKVTMDDNEKGKLKALLTKAKQLAALALGQDAEEGESAIAKVRQLLQAQGGGTKGKRFATHRNSTQQVDHALSQLEKDATNSEAEQKRTTRARARHRKYKQATQKDSHSQHRTARTAITSNMPRRHKLERENGRVRSSGTAQHCRVPAHSGVATGKTHDAVRRENCNGEELPRRKKGCRATRPKKSGKQRGKKARKVHRTKGTGNTVKQREKRCGSKKRHARARGTHEHTQQETLGL
ncbi:hypothetical protein ERJ75_001175800 [Trypanosoma vivax]|nr:hypothetical protein ERJ75_001175800 [Trypanosoma vivax]